MIENKELTQAAVPLVVDLDGTLSKTDTLVEAFLLLIKKNVFFVFLLPFWLLKGKAFFKQKIAQSIDFNANDLVYNDQLISYIKAAKQEGRDIYLATGADQIIANAVQEKFDLFDGVFASDGCINLTGSKKCARLIETFGENAFEYAGNADIDIKVWRSASHALVVCPSAESLAKKAQSVCSNVQSLSLEPATFKTYIKAIRVHQWVKNVLLFVPLITAHLLGDGQAWLTVSLGFIAFSLAASSVYVLNDLLDLSSDRQHHSKCRRPFAAGVISLEKGALLFPVLFVAAFVIASFLPKGFIVALAIYYVLTVLYSFVLKRIVMLDTVVLATLYTMRIIAGTLLIQMAFSFWLLAFSMFIFLSLALMKRYTELVQLIESNKLSTLGRGYHTGDAPMVASFGTSSGLLAVLVLALYVNSDVVQVYYHTEQVLWLACPVLMYWISRAWMIAHRGLMDDDPIIFAVKDRQSLVTCVCIAMIFLAASYAWPIPSYMLN
ncbi:MAG: UbiA family prenyltransferase [Sinobacterium sp.]|nr:UbiA family prenyltransferase [Sinobacterium sp.]